MWKVRDTTISKTKYRCYSPTSMIQAVNRVRETGSAIRTTARQYGVPEASLRHKLSGRVNPDSVRSGPPPMFSQEEEAHFVQHLKFMSSCGYGYSRSEVIDMASDYAVSLNRRTVDKHLSFQWYSSFMSRWPELKILKPRGLQLQRAKATTFSCVTNYYRELEHILVKYQLKDKPERIYNIDEKGLSTSHKPPSVLSSSSVKPQAITSGTRQTVTVIGCGNAIGHSIPPYFVFPGCRMRQDLLHGGCPGVNGNVSESGWSNSTIFRSYIEFHLLKYLPERSADNPVLILYDGHKSHININLITWAKTENLILFILPAHTSHVLQPLDIGCFGPLERIYNTESHKFMRQNCGKTVTRYNVCELGCTAYVKALSPDNLKSSFRKAGIYPFNPNVLSASVFVPSEPLQETVSLSEEPSCEFFSQKEAPIRSNKPAATKRRYLSHSVSGKPITEDNIAEIVRNHQHSQATVKPSTSAVTKRSKKDIPPARSEDTLSESSDDNDTEVCCVCNLYSPKEIQNSTSLIILKWVECSACGHWVHLAFCTEVRVIRRGDTFLCPHCV